MYRQRFVWWNHYYTQEGVRSCINIRSEALSLSIRGPYRMKRDLVWLWLDLIYIGCHRLVHQRHRSDICTSPKIVRMPLLSRFLSKRGDTTHTQTNSLFLSERCSTHGPYHGIFRSIQALKSPNWFGQIYYSLGWWVFEGCTSWSIQLVQLCCLLMRRGNRRQNLSRVHLTRVTCEWI